MNNHSARNIPYQQKKRNMIVAAKTGPCLDCGKDFGDWRVMDLDHVPERGPKLFSPGNRYSEVGFERLAVEIAKCDRVCPLCHRFRTLARKGADVSSV